MKRLLLIIALLISGLGLNAQDATIGDLKFTITSETSAECKVSGYSGEPVDVTIPSTVTISGKEYSVTSIGNFAFDGCSLLTSIEIPSGVTSIGEWTFSNCSSLTSIEIPSGVTSIGYGAFTGCSSLTSIEIPSGVTSIGYGAFSNCSSLTSIEIPSGVTSIGEWAFSYCSSLTSIEIPSGVTSIGDYAFVVCSSLTSIEIPSGVTSIGEDAFSDCSSLTSIEIPSGVTSIGGGAFGWCVSLTSIYCYAESVPETASDAFKYCPSSMIIYVPAQSVNAYKATSPWNEYTIEAMEEQPTPSNKEYRLLSITQTNENENITYVYEDGTNKVVEIRHGVDQGYGQYTTFLNYDANGLLISTEYVFADVYGIDKESMSAPTWYTVEYTYDVYGKLTSYTVKEFKNWTLYQEPCDITVYTLVYEGNNVVEITSTGKYYDWESWCDWSPTKYTYSYENGKLVGETKSYYDQWAATPGFSTDYTVTYAYNEAGNCVSATKSNGEVTEYIYDETILAANVYSFAFPHEVKPVSTNIIATATTGKNVATYNYSFVKVAEAVSATEIALTWNEVENAMSYNVYQGETLLGNVTSTAYTVEGLAVYTDYCFTVEAVRNAQSFVSEQVCAKTLDLVIAAPENLVAEATSISTIVLTWEAVENALSYNVYVDTELVANVTDTTFTVEGLASYTDYSFTVSAVRNEQEVVSEVASARTLDLQIEMPTNVFAAATGTTTIALTWNAVENAMSYNVYQGETLLGNVTSTAYTVESLAPYTNYCFTVEAVRNAQSFVSEATCAKTLDLTIAVPVVEAEATSDSTITLTWNEVENALSYNIYSADTLVANVTGTSFTVEGLDVYTEYSFIVSALRNEQEMVSEAVNAKTLDLTIVAPVVVAEVTSATEIVLTWEAVENAFSYVVYQGEDSIANVIDTTFTVEGLDVYTEYSFIVSALRNEQEMVSEAVSAKTLDLTIAAPVVEAEATSDSTITLTWNEVENALSYNIYSADTLVANVTGTSYTVLGLEADTEYGFIVSAVRNEQEVMSETVSARTLVTEEPGGDEPTDPEQPGEDDETCTITAVANPEEAGTISGAGTYLKDMTVTLTATANEGYKFVNWTENDVIVSTDAEYSFVIAKDRNLVANFELINEEKTYNVTAVANPEEAGTIIGAGTYLKDMTVTLTATANEGYKFVNWTENGVIISTDAEYSFVITKDRDLVANFISTEGIEENASAFNIYPNPVSDKLYIETLTKTLTVEIYDVYGRQQSMVNGQQSMVIDVTNLNSGVYFVKVVTKEGETVKRFIKK